MMQHMIAGTAAVLVLLLSGCASVPMASSEEDLARKQFLLPSSEMAGLYVYRDESFGAAVRKSVTVDGKPLGQTAAKTYFNTEVSPGRHVVATDSEFGDNQIVLDAEAGKNYFIRQNIKMGLMTAGATLLLMDEAEGKRGVLQCTLASNPYLVP